MNHWIAATCKAKKQALKDPDVDELELKPDEKINDAFKTSALKKLRLWKSVTLDNLFGKAFQPRKCKVALHAILQEEELMEKLTNMAENAIPNDGAIEIDDGEEYIEQ
ncbi:unnamed protein product [Mycena citricolor]|uniref:Uncharacterized protein n=1 Tax=Mycena citricolor TaxID=2018698 RepID=A0AAD2JV96_9AGAR|nr:unnamed protein product [Mycena citricolor]